jgi:hypothetical protein
MLVSGRTGHDPIHGHGRRDRYVAGLCRALSVEARAAQHHHEHLDSVVQRREDRGRREPAVISGLERRRLPRRSDRVNANLPDGLLRERVRRLHHPRLQLPDAEWQHRGQSQRKSMHLGFQCFSDQSYKYRPAHLPVGLRRWNDRHDLRVVHVTHLHREWAVHRHGHRIGAGMQGIRRRERRYQCRLQQYATPSATATASASASAASASASAAASAASAAAAATTNDGGLWLLPLPGSACDRSRRPRRGGALICRRVLPRRRARGAHGGFGDERDRARALGALGADLWTFLVWRAALPLPPLQRVRHRGIGRRNRVPDLWRLQHMLDRLALGRGALLHRGSDHRQRGERFRLLAQRVPIVFRHSNGARAGRG